jgi:hypothetical protein
MNHYLGITEKHRPLTVHCFSYWNIMNVNVPIVESKYYSSQFELRVHSLTTKHTMLNTHTLRNTFLHHRVYGFNEQIASALGVWSRPITNAEGYLDKDVRVFTAGGNTLNIEKWDKNKCIHRVLVSHYNQAKDKNERNITNIDKNPVVNQFDSLAYREDTYRLVVIQRPQGISVYSIDMF